MWRYNMTVTKQALNRAAVKILDTLKSVKPILIGSDLRANIASFHTRDELVITLNFSDPCRGISGC